VEIHPRQFTIQSVPPRIDRVRDLFRGVLTDQQDLLPAIEQFKQIVES
jgi:DNA primase